MILAHLAARFSTAFDLRPRLTAGGSTPDGNRQFTCSAVVSSNPAATTAYFGLFGLSNQLVYTYSLKVSQPVPVITSVLPASAVTVGGTVITMDGMYLFYYVVSFVELF
jgi:hypothetical protein